MVKMQSLKTTSFISMRKKKAYGVRKNCSEPMSFSKKLLNISCNSCKMSELTRAYMHTILFDNCNHSLYEFP